MSELTGGSLTFQSTLPARGATGTAARKYQRTTDFNPRSPHGERRFCCSLTSKASEFQSTLPARGATIVASGSSSPMPFQSTLPARGATSMRWNSSCIIARFQSTLPARGATHRVAALVAAEAISIHAPRTGSDTGRSAAASAPSDFNPRSPHGERPSSPALCCPRSHFNPRSPHGERLFVARQLVH